MKLFVILTVGLCGVFANAADFWFVEVKLSDLARFQALVPVQERVVQQQSQLTSLRPSVRPLRLFESESTIKFIIFSESVENLAQIPGLKLTKANDIMTSFSAERVSDSSNLGAVTSGSTISRLEMKIYNGPLTLEVAKSIQEALRDPLAAFQSLHPAEYEAVAGLAPVRSVEAGFETKVFFNVYVMGSDLQLFQMRIPYLTRSQQVFSSNGSSGYVETVIPEEDATATEAVAAATDPCEQMVR